MKNTQLQLLLQIVILIVLFVLRKRIGLVVALFHEAGKAVHAMPYLVLIPLLVCQFKENEIRLEQ